MSTGLELLPLALAITAVVGAVRSMNNPANTAPMLTVKTRMRDHDVLGRALARCGQDFGVVEGMHMGAMGSLAVAFGADVDGTFIAFFDPKTEEGVATQLVEELDAAYCRCVQDDALRNLYANAGEYGLRVSGDHVDQDGSIVVVLEVEEAARA
jgi:hypothetical protein